MAIDEMKRILIITTIGGFLPQFEINDVKILIEQGYEIHYASNFDNPVYMLDTKFLEEMGIRLHPIGIQQSPLRIKRNIIALKDIIAIIRKEEISVIHCHNPLGGVLGRLAAMINRTLKPYVIYTAHGFHFYKGAPIVNWLLYFPVEYFLAKHTNCIITINKEDDIIARRLLSGKLNSLFKIPGVGVKTVRFAPNAETRRQVRKDLQIEDETFYILSVGELNHNKNHEVIIRAIASLKDPNICYGICGNGYHRKYLEKLAQAKGIEHQVRFYGFRNDIPQMLQGADCFAFPSKREGLGIAAIEAMAAGLPMITSDCRGTREYMKDAVTGYICRSGKASEYAKIIKRMKDEPDKRKKMSVECRIVAEYFNLTKTDKIMREIYSSLKT